MGQTYPGIDEQLATWIAAQPMFFVGSAPLSGDGHVNLSPKGPIGSLCILSPHQVAYLDVVGSGAETAAHLQENGRIAIMFCAFTGPPRIVRLHGRGTVVWAEDPAFHELLVRARFEEPSVPESRRAIIRVDVTRISDSCGYGVPLMQYQGRRPQGEAWARSKLAKGGPNALQDHKRERNSRSIDGLPSWKSSTR